MKTKTPYFILSALSTKIFDYYKLIADKVYRQLFLTLLPVYCLAFINPVSANVYVTNTFTDPVISSLNNATGTINGGATISLRSALMAADNLGGNHTVTLSTGTYNLTQALPNRQITIGNTAQNITINGNGPANTIISNTLDANKDRILTINYNGTTPNVITTISGVKFQNGYLTSDEYGGAAIYAGPIGGFFESLTVIDCAFDNNICPGAAGNGGVGGAIYMFQETLTVDNCTFTNNSSVDGVAGAIFFTLYNNQGNNGNVNITNSTFSGNSARELGGAIHITSQGAQPGGITFTTTINNNTFLNNFTTVGLGGAVTLNNGANLSVMQMHFNRFVGNTSASSALSSGLHFVESSGSVNAENNWWGCNSNPVSGGSTAPCNQAGGDVAGGGSLDANPWLQLKVTASPNTICNSTPTNLGNTSNITASFLNNSDGTAIPVANLSRFIGLPVTWPATTLGSLSSTQTTIQANGTATTLFTSNGTGGNATVNSQVDNVPSNETSPARATITVNTTSIIPTGATGTTTICNGSGTTLTVSGGLKGTAAVAQWYTGSCGGSLLFTGDALNVSPTSTTNYFVRYNGTCNTTNCATVTVTVNNPSVAPTSITGTTLYCNPGSTTLTAIGGTLGTNANYQWGTGSVVGTNPIGGATNSTLNVSPISTTTYWVRIENTAAPCTGNTAGVTQVVTVNHPSVAPTSITGTTTICSPGSTTLIASGGTLGTDANYQWGTGAVVGTSPIAGATNSSLLVSPGSTTTYWVWIENAAAPCTQTTGGVTQVVTVNNPSVAPSGISGITTICNPGSTTLTATGGTLGTNANYQWGTGAIVGTNPIGGATNLTLIISPTSTTTYWVRIENTTAPCATNTGGVTQVISVQPPVAPAISGNLSFCSGSSTTLNAGSFSGYNWSTGATTQTISVNTATTYTVTVSDGFGCTGSNSVTVSSIVFDDNNACTTDACDPTTGNVTHTPVSSDDNNACTTDACDPASGIISHIPVNTDDNNVCTTDACDPITGTSHTPVNISDGIDCTKDACDPVIGITHIDTCGGCTNAPIKPDPITTFGGVAKVCPGDLKTYFIAPVEGATSYTWTAQAGTTSINHPNGAGANDTLVRVTYSTGFSYSFLSVQAVNTCGTSPERHLYIKRNDPRVPSVITGNPYGNCGLSGVSYSVINKTGITYNWSFSTTTASIASGQGTNAITADFDPSYVSGQLRVSATNSCGTSGLRATNIFAKPAAPSSLTGTNSVCANQTGVPYSTSPVVTATSYTWGAPVHARINDGSITSSSNTMITSATSVTVNFGSSAGNVKVRANNACAPGSYNSLHVNIVCRGDESQANQLDANCYPSPASTELNVTFVSDKEQTNLIRITDLVGETVMLQNHYTSVGDNLFILDVSTLASGIYMIEVMNGDQRSIQKIVIE